MPADDQKLDADDIQEELGIVLAGKAMARSPQLQAMLKYMVTETLAGRADKLKAYAIAVDVLGRDVSFDPNTDAIVRVQAGRLRSVLDSHYSDEGRDSRLRIELPKGTYVPVFVKARSGPDLSMDRPEVESGGAAVPMHRSSQLQPQPGAASSPAFADGPDVLSGGKVAPALPSFVLYSILGLLIAAAALIAYILPKAQTGPESRGRPSQQPAFNSLVIGPFTSLDSAVDQQRLAKAVTAEIATSLTRSPLVELRLATAESQGAGDELHQFARTQNAHWTLTGVLHRASARQRLNVFVTDVVAGRVVWSQDYDVPADEITAEKLADAIILDLRPQLYLLAKRAIEARPNPTAVELFVLATWSPGLETNTLEWQLGRVELARRAIASEPRFGPAYSVLADKLSLLAQFVAKFDTEATWKEADAAARQASLLTPHSSEIAFNLALYHLHGGQIDEATRWVKRTLELAPRHTLARFWVWVLPYNCMRAPDEVIAELIRFDAGLSPANPARWQTKAWLARLHLNREEYGAATVAAQESMQVVPNLGAALIMIVGLVQNGKAEEARRVFQDQMQYWPGFTFAHYNDVSLPRTCRGSPILDSLLKAHRDAANALR